MEINDTLVSAICRKFMDYNGWKKIDYINLSKKGIKPLLIKKDDDNSLLLFDDYKSLLNDIKKFIIQDLEANGGWSESFYLDIEDINSLQLYKYVNIDKDVEKLIDDLKDITKWNCTLFQEIILTI